MTAAADVIAAHGRNLAQRHGGGWVPTCYCGWVGKVVASDGLPVGVDVLPQQHAEHVVQALTDAGYAVVQLPGVVVETEDEHTQYGCRSVASWVGRTSYDQGRTYVYTSAEVETTTEVYTSGLSPHEARCHAAVLLAAAAAADAAAEEVR